MAEDELNQPASDGSGGGGEEEDAAKGEEKAAEKDALSSSSLSSEDEESDYDSEYSSDDYRGGGEGGGEESGDYDSEEENSPEVNIRRLTEALESRTNKKLQEEDEENYVHHEDLYDFPPDPEKWREEDLQELWADAPLDMTEPGWDPVWADEEEWEVVRHEMDAGRDPPIAPFYVPYRRYYPAIPDNHYDISNPKSVIEELDRIEEFLKWVSYVFPDGSTYEGTVWDDLAHGKGVYVAEQGLVRYEGEWLQNQMEGHGVVEVDIPDVEPVPGSKLEAKMRAEGRIISMDFMTPEDRRWLEMDVEDSYRLSGNLREIPFYEREEWVKVFGQKPEKGRYRYAGQWKHGRMHGCGVYEVNERIIYGRFYFGELLEDSTGCDSDVSALHGGIAEVAAAKARMFINKPDGMVREERGPYGDPQHPYFYEEEDVWMAPGFINQFYEVPDYWKTYVEEVDQEREMWLNSFYKAPLRIPMPAELEYWWSKGDDDPEFVLINKEPEPDPEDPSKLIYTEDPLILHTRTGRLINYVDDEQYGVRLFWQPRVEHGEDVDPEKIEFLPLGLDEFFGRGTKYAKKESGFTRLITAVQNALKPLLDKLEKWTEERKEGSEMKQKLIEKELEFIEAEICLEEAIEDLETLLKMKQKEEEKRAAAGKDSDDFSRSADLDDADSEDGEDEDEDEDEGAPTSFGTVEGEVDKETTADSTDESKLGKSPFSSLSLSFTTCSLASLVPPKLHGSSLSWKKRKLPFCSNGFIHLNHEKIMDNQEKFNSVKFSGTIFQRTNLRMAQLRRGHCKKKSGYSQMYSLARILSAHQAQKGPKMIQAKGRSAGAHSFNILSLHVPVTDDFTPW
ncbi:protein TIC 100 [Elaeis guineensis]|uniref:protein TIC 100 n=1 Tax=Elaeis guineensis var. tenera TaxID=51953 RepID=UPI003C6CDEB9